MELSSSQHLQRQLRYIETSSKTYDDGNYDEAIRIATALRIIFHQTPRSTSLLTHLGANGIELCSTSAGTPPDDGLGLNVANNLITNLFTGEMRAAPWLDKAPRKAAVPFSVWWKEEVVIFNTGIQMTRKDLVLGAANKDGGAHVDYEQRDAYDKVLRGLDFTFTITNHGDGSQRLAKPEGLHLAALRQFAYEVLVSPDILRLAWPSPQT